MRSALFAALAGLLLAGCANRLAAREAALAALVGTSEADLLRQYGVPTRTAEAGGHRFLAYAESWVEVVPGGPWNWRGAYGGGFPPEVVQRLCETTFEIADGRVRAYTLRGNACG